MIFNIWTQTWHVSGSMVTLTVTASSEHARNTVIFLTLQCSLQ